MITIHQVIKGFDKFPFNEKEGILIIAFDEKAVSSLCHTKKKLFLLDAFIRVFRKNPELRRICKDAITLLQESSKKSKKTPKKRSEL